MKRVALSVITVLTMSTFAVAGGDIAPVEPVVETPEVVSTPGNFYVGLGYSYVNADFTWDSSLLTAVTETPVNGEFTADSVLFLAGYNFNEYIGIEGRYTINVGDPTLDNGVDPKGDVNVDISNIAAYLKLMYPIDKLNLYALLGYGQTKFDYTGGNASESGFQWAIGGSYALTDNWGIFVDYTRMYDDSGYFDDTGMYNMTVDAVSVGVTYKF